MIDQEISLLVRQEIHHIMSEFRSSISDGATHDDAVIIADDLSRAESENQEIDSEGFMINSGSMCGAFAFEGGKIKVGGIYRARKFKLIEGIDVPDDFTGYAYVEVQMGASENPDEVKLSESYPDMESDDVSIMMLYKFKDGSVEEDYRGSPHVQMWE